jgi:hypothetical protein
MLNQEHIKRIIKDNKLINRTGSSRNHGKLIHAAVVNNHHNLVYGPGYNTNGKSHRGEDPGPEIETGILEKLNNDEK